MLTGLVNQKCGIQSTFDWHPNECNQEFHYYPFTVELEKCLGSFNTLNDVSNKVCVPNKTRYLNLTVLFMNTGMNESKTLTKIYNVNVNIKLTEEIVIQVNGGIMINVDVSVKNIMYVKRIMFGILLHIIVKMENI